MLHVALCITPCVGKSYSPALKAKPNIRTTNDMTAKLYPSIVTNMDNFQLPHNRKKCEITKDEIVIAIKRTPISRTLRDFIGFLPPACLSSISHSPQIYCFFLFVVSDSDVYPIRDLAFHFCLACCSPSLSVFIICLCPSLYLMEHSSKKPRDYVIVEGIKLYGGIILPSESFSQRYRFVPPKTPKEYSLLF